MQVKNRFFFRKNSATSNLRAMRLLLGSEWGHGRFFPVFPPSCSLNSLGLNECPSIQGEIHGNWKLPFSALGTSHGLGNYKEVEELKKNTFADQKKGKPHISVYIY